MKIALTGIKPTSGPHLGNYIGAIRPGLAMCEQYDTYFFIADHHALNAISDAKNLRAYTHEVAATWLALGLDPERATFYRQSDIPETFELVSFLSNVTSKGLLNRAHAYKAAVAKNLEAGQDPDDGISFGLYNYPLLMAADILLFSADSVPVGKDQVQHVEITRDIAMAFNRIYGDILRVPEPLFGVDALVTGLDGRKMSKSYNNTIPLFSIDSAKLKKLVRSIKTDSTAPDAPKDADSASIFQLYRQFVGADASAAVRTDLMEGKLSWGAMKDILFDALDTFLIGPRLTYQKLMENPSQIDEILKKGGQRARPKAQALLEKIRHATGIS